MAGHSDPGRRFAFQLVVAGDYLLQAEAPGFRSREISLTVEPREVRSIIVPLAVAGVEATVDVAGSPVSIWSTHSPSSTALDSDRLDRLPAGLRENLPEAIVAAAPGMIRGHDDFVHVRGHESP